MVGMGYVGLDDETIECGGVCSLETKMYESA